MKRIQHLFTIAATFSIVLASPRAHAQWAVVDVGAIAQLVQQVSTLEQQLSTAQQHLTQAQQTYQSMSGGRGMQLLLSGTVRNYLPSDWSQVQTTLSQANGASRALAAGIQAAIHANAILTPQQMAAFSPAEQAQINADRQSAAALQSMTRTALVNTSSRFASIQQLINAIPSATDQKGILDLQARIQAEQGMLSNEQTKLQTLYQAAQADGWASSQRAKEQSITDIGSFRHLPPMGLNE